MNNVLNHILNYNIEQAEKSLLLVSNNQKRSILKWHVNAMKSGISDSIVSGAIKEEPDFINILSFIKNALIYQEPVYDRDTIAARYLRIAKDLSIQKQDTLLTKYALQQLMALYFGNPALRDYLEKYADEYKDYVKTRSDSANYMYHKYSAKSWNEKKEYINEYEKALQLLNGQNSHYLEGIVYQVLGVQESTFRRDFNKGIEYFNKASNSFEKVNGYIGNVQMFAVNNNIGVAYNYMRQPEKALSYFEKAKTTPIPSNSFLQKSYNYLGIAQTFQSLELHDSAYYYFQKEKEAIGDFNEYKSAIAIKESNIKYETEKKEKENLQLKADNLEIEAKRKQNRNLLLAALAVLLFGGITFVLIQKNTKRKQLLAEQQKELQTQKLATVLKEQELKSIDAMIAGQEKERQRIANDLHDDLGGLMATVKLHFNVLKEEPSNELYDKTTKLLDEAYQKVRSVAHSKNSGVMANKGLLKAINDMATNISASNKLQIGVNDHGLENRLENSLELTIFRIVQELVTNIIKHADATEASIHITNHEDSLNILVEDNGKGFNTKDISKKEGMGIHSIDKRVENLGGTVTIESELRKGTTVIIDIPT